MRIANTIGITDIGYGSSMPICYGALISKDTLPGANIRLEPEAILSRRLLRAARSFRMLHQKNTCQTNQRE